MFEEINGLETTRERNISIDDGMDRASNCGGARRFLLFVAVVIPVCVELTFLKTI